jgi:hypothetical protein
MTQFEQIQKMKQSLHDALVDVLHNHKVHIGVGLLETDVIGVIEKVKFDYMLESTREHITLY